MAVQGPGGCCIKAQADALSETDLLNAPPHIIPSSEHAKRQAVLGAQIQTTQTLQALGMVAPGTQPAEAMPNEEPPPEAVPDQEDIAAIDEPEGDLDLGVAQEVVDSALPLSEIANKQQVQILTAGRTPKTETGLRSWLSS